MVMLTGLQTASLLELLLATTTVLRMVQRSVRQLARPWELLRVCLSGSLLETATALRLVKR
jgi:hypothetical protein